MVGYLGHGDGTHIEIKINTAAVLAAAQAASSNARTNIKLNLFAIYSSSLAIFPYTKPVRARVECVSGCSCSQMMLDGSNSVSYMLMDSTEVSSSSMLCMNMGMCQGVATNR